MRFATSPELGPEGRHGLAASVDGVTPPAARRHGGKDVRLARRRLQLRRDVVAEGDLPLEAVRRAGLEEVIPDANAVHIRLEHAQARHQPVGPSDVRRIHQTRLEDIRARRRASGRAVGRRRTRRIGGGDPMRRRGPDGCRRGRRKCKRPRPEEQDNGRRSHHLHRNFLQRTKIVSPPDPGTTRDSVLPSSSSASFALRPVAGLTGRRSALISFRPSTLMLRRLSFTPPQA